MKKQTQLAPLRRTAYIHTCYALFLLFYLWLAQQIPYTFDDWDWGCAVGIKQLQHATLNNRYAGNFVVVVLTRSVFLKTLVMGITFFLIPLLLSLIITKNVKENRQLATHIFFLISNIFLLSMGHMVWSQTYSWVSGFANYVFSAVFLLILIYALSDLLMENPVLPEDHFASYILFFLIALVGQFFIENLSIFVALLCVAACIFCAKRFRRIPPRYLSMTLGALIGLFLMFSNSLYATLFQTGSAVSGHRSLSLDPQSGIMKNIFSVIIQIARLIVGAGEQNLVLCCSILLALTFLLLRLRPRGKYKSTTILCTVNILLVGYFAYINTQSMDYSVDNLIQSILVVIPNGLYFLAVILETFLLRKNRSQQTFQLLFYFFSGILVLAPMAVTSVAGSRIYFISNLFFFLYIMSIIFHSYCAWNKKTIISVCSICLLLCIVLRVFHGYHYQAIGACTEQRLEIIQNALASNQTQITLPKYPYEEYLWYPDPNNDFRWTYFRSFFGIPDTISITIQ